MNKSKGVATLVGIIVVLITMMGVSYVTKKIHDKPAHEEVDKNS